MPEPNKTPQNPELQRLLEALTEVDKNPPTIGQVGLGDKRVHAYLHERINLVQKIVQLDKADQRENWYRQLFDNLMAMAQNNCDDATINLLKKLSDDVAVQMPGSNLAAYGVYRFHWTGYAVGMVKAEAVEPAKRTKAITAVQDLWLDNLADFVKKYSKAEDTAEGLYQLGNGCEFGGKIEEAKRWYGQLAESFPNHHLSPRSRGCVARLNLVGNPLPLTAPVLGDASKQFDVASLKGKVVIVHYWSSQSDQFEADFLRLNRLMKDVGTKQGVELVCISLDDTAAKAAEAVRKTQAAGIHLYQAPPNNAGGSNSPLAIQYGIHMLPTVFVIGRDGRVTNNAVQVGDIETELKKGSVGTTSSSFKPRSEVHPSGGWTLACGLARHCVPQAWPPSRSQSRFPQRRIDQIPVILARKHLDRAASLPIFFCASRRSRVAPSR